MALLPNWDSFSIQRRSASADAEGNAFTGVVDIDTATGVYGSASGRDQAAAAQRGQTIDAFISTNYAGIHVGDLLTLRGRVWTVVMVKDVRIHYRIGIRLSEVAG